MLLTCQEQGEHTAGPSAVVGYMHSLVRLPGRREQVQDGQEATQMRKHTCSNALSLMESILMS